MQTHNKVLACRYAQLLITNAAMSNEIYSTNNCCCIENPTLFYNALKHTEQK